MDVLAQSLKARLALCAAIEKLVVFDRYTEISAKDHERQRRAGVDIQLGPQQPSAKS